MQSSKPVAMPIILGHAGRRFAIVIAAIGCLLVPSNGFTQTVPSWPVDPLMTAKDESRIFKLLGRTIAPPANGTPLRSMVETLPVELSMAIDEHALDEIGVSAEDPVQTSLPSPAPLIVHLLAILNQHDLTIQLRHNALTITTLERSEEDYPVRVYDITTLANQSRRFSINKLKQVIQASIAPESWEALGGPGVFSTQFALNKKHLVIANSTLTHLRIDTFLNRIAGDRDYRPIPGMHSQANLDMERDPPEDLMTARLPAGSGLVNFANPNANDDAVLFRLR